VMSHCVAAPRPGSLLVLLSLLATVVRCQLLNSKEHSECVVDVLVLGAGMAGSKAAADLATSHKLHTLVLEQSDRIGGRMWATPWAGETIELGANWIEGIPQNENPIWTIAQEIGLMGNYTDQEDGPVKPTLYDHNGPVPQADAHALHTKLARALSGAQKVSCDHHLSNKGDLSLREALLQAGWPAPEDQTHLEKTLEFFVVDWDFQYPPEAISTYNYFSVGHADSWNETCTKPAQRPGYAATARTAARLGMLGNFSWESPRYFVTDPRGYSAVARHLVKDIPIASQHACPAHSAIVFNKTVTSIQYAGVSGPTSRGCSVQTSDGSTYTARFCISTFSSGVVNAAIETQQLFQPPLPSWKAAAFAKAQNGIYTKIFLRYRTSFWADADYVLYADPTRRGHYAVWQDLESHHKFFPSKANILMVTVVQADSQRVETQPEHQTISEIQDVLKVMYGSDIPEPEQIYIPRWNSDPGFRGCWSNIAINATASDFTLMQKSVGGLHFAGEATDYDFNGFTLGGYTSGQRAAASVLNEASKKGILKGS